MKLSVRQLSAGMVQVASEEVADLAKAIFMRAGVPDDDASLVARSLVDADLRGMNSHGIIRLPVYIERLLKGGVNARPKFKLISESPGTALYDADGGLGALATSKGMAIAIEKARTNGIGAVGIRNSNHNGEGARYVRQAVDAGMIGIATTNSSPIMPVWGGKDALTGPLPIAFGIPANGDPIILDMALGMSSRGKILYYLEKGMELPPGWLVDNEGRPTTDPSWVNKGGWILPIGGHKGWGLILMCEILSGILTGGASGRELTNLYDNLDTPQRNGHLVIALNVASFLDIGYFKTLLDEYVSTIKSSELAPGFDEILLPGEIESRKRRQQLLEGITISHSLVRELLALATSLNIEVSEAA